MINEELKNIIQIIENEMEVQKLTMSDLSRLTGISQAVISRTMNLKTIPNFNTIFKICNVLSLKITLIKKEG